MDKKLFDRLVKSAEQMVAIEKGEMQPTPNAVTQFRIPDVKKIRANTHLKQNEFADLLGVSTALVQSWETARRVPNGPALKLLNILESQPQILETLRAV
ncbi:MULTISPECIES: NadS family protein [unclassified Avibacterium]|uniref:NadS family protein n=1 Tax=unclassified Avibacterium TaxID=2685287 RepID=UPI002027296F|nr:MULTISPECIES: NadS family protein [unclassified Avibacterium]MCW9699837.1 helix-turn-helix domain-containing protein [Avibacterium sp. 20-129]URL06453.1 helix-turn-helix domain-containing protein [Avibacterium sp. 21-595]